MKGSFISVLVLLSILTTTTAQENEVTASEKTTMDSVWNALSGEPALVNHHRGFLAYMSAHPELARTLEVAGSLERHPILGERITSFDVSLEQDQQSQDLFQGFYASLAGDEQLREGVDAVYRVELGSHSPWLQAAFIKLKGDVDYALRFLINPAKPAPLELYPLRKAFRKDPEFREELSHALAALHKMPSAHNAVFPWWRNVARETDAVSRAYASLTAELVKQPGRFWVWHIAQVELAKDLKARPWIVYWRRRVKQDRVLAAQYDAYLDIIRRRPDYGRAALDAWQADLGPAPAWPPDSAPPHPPVPPPKTRAGPKMPGRPEVERPRTPMPHMPDMPTMPERPEKPPTPARY